MSNFALVKNKQNFASLLHMDNTGRMVPLVRESEIFDEKGYDFLYICETHHLSRQDVRKLISYLEHWVTHSELK